MKKILHFVALLCVSSFAYAYETWTDPKTNVRWTYEILSNGDAVIGGGSESYTAVPKTTQGHLNVPSVLRGCPVRKVANKAFYKCTGIVSVIFPEGVREIGESAFYGCSSLVSISISSDVEHIGAKAFRGCSVLSGITLPVNVDLINEDCFYDCRELAFVLIPESVTNICNNAFWGCQKLRNVNIPQAVRNIGRMAFYGCASIESIKIPNGIKELSGAFNGCSNLNTVEIPPSVKRICGSAFNGCNSIDAVHISDLKEWCEMDFESGNCNPIRGANHFYVNGEDIKKLNIPPNVESINQNAFFNWIGVESVSIPATVTKIGDSAFYECSSLSAVELTLGVEEIGEESFAECACLTTISIPSTVKRIGKWAFANCEALGEGFVVKDGCLLTNNGECPSEYVLPSDIRIISGGVFDSNLRSVVLPMGLKEINEYAFYNCTHLSTFNIPQSVTNICEYAFYNCRGFSDLTIPGNVKKIGNHAFEYCQGLKTLKIEKGVEELGRFSFGECPYLNSIAIPPSVLRIGSDVITSSYSGPVAKKDVFIEDLAAWFRIDFENISANPLYLAKRLFLNGAEQKELTIPDGIKNVNYAFAGWGDLQSVIFSSSVTNVYERLFSKCMSIGHVKMPLSLLSLSATFPGSYSSLSSVEIPEGASSIDGAVFAGCAGLSTISIPSSVTRIDSGAFIGCKGLKAVGIPDCVESVSTTFPDAYKGITNVWFTEHVREIRSGEFKNCSQLMVCSLPETVTNIGVSAFSGCVSLKKLTIPDAVKKVGTETFRDCTSIESIELPDGLAEIPFEMFYNCSMLKEVMLPKNVSEIGKYAFYNCSSLRSISLPNSVTKIEGWAFYGCSDMVSAELSESLQVVDMYAFQRCRRLTSIKIPPNVLLNATAFYDTGLWNLSDDGTVIKDGYFLGIKGVLPSELTIRGADVIAEYSLAGNVELKAVVLDGVASIGSCAFRGCANLAAITIPKSVTAIHADAFAGCTGLKTIFVDKYDKARVRGLMLDSGFFPVDEVEFVEIGGSGISIAGDEEATVIGDVETGLIIKPSEWNTAVEVTIPEGVDAAKVTVEVSPKVATVKPNGAKVKIVVGENDITDYLVIPESGGVLNIAAATVKEEIVKETLDPSKDAVIELDAENPRLTTAPTRKGLIYTLYEGRRLESLLKGDSKLGDGDPWRPTITVSGGDAAFYSIDVSK